MQIAADTPPLVQTPPAPLTGLSPQEVAERQARGQTNNYKARVSRTYWDIVAENLFNLFNIVLFSLLIVVLAFRDYGTAIFSGFSVVTNTFLGMIQEANAKRKLDKLAALSASRVRVRRGGRVQEISMLDVVLDDLLLIEPGDRLVVDGVVVASDALEMDESLLTGESDAVFKEVGQEAYSGSFCIAGTGIVRATRVGKDSNINKLAAIAKEYKRIRTPTQVYIDIIVEVTVVLMFVFAPLVMIASYIVNQEPILNAVRNTLVFVTSLVPQGLVLVAAISLTIGALKISRQRTLIQRVNAVESLANATVLCFDKTGTLTKNQLAVTQVIALNASSQAEILAQLRPYLDNLGHLNRTAAAVREYVQAHAPQQEESAPRKVREIPFTSQRKWGAVVFADSVYALGAPERLLPHSSASESVSNRVLKLSREGLRVLAFARLPKRDDYPDDLSALSEPIALIVLSDQIREDIQQTLAAFIQEGLELKVISGDNLETVEAIARQAGFVVRKGYTGAQIQAMSDADLQAAVKEANVFARIEPNDKRRLVAALQANRQYVAMVGDGVNDVPALKKANLAIVMNDGTQISKDVADIVLLDNAMSTLPKAFHEGKTITQIIYGTNKMFLAKNLYNIFWYILIPFLYLPFPVTPIQISWATFGTINIPATFVAIGWLKPAFMKSFRDDVLDFVLTHGFLGTIYLTLLHVTVYLTDGPAMAQSASTVFLGLYGAVMVMAVMGVDLYQPRSFLERRGAVIFMSVMAVITTLALYLFPDFFNFIPFNPVRHWYIIVLLTALTCLSFVLAAHGNKYRYLIRRLWVLFQKN
ncbi:MAG: HAD-IC family P-type ATPase [Anaerolineae bacterium]|nr:HAD-IC family P-type ATPase [Anaerolineae bacterium]